MSVFKRGAIFYYDFILHGVRYAATTKKKNRREAEKVETKVRREEEGRINAATSKEPNSLTFGDAMGRLHKERWSRTRDAKKTLARIERLITLLGADTPLSAIDNAAISRLSVSLRARVTPSGREIADATVNRYLSTLKTLFVVACREWQVIPSVPYIKTTKEPQGRLRTFSVGEETRIQEILREKEQPHYTEVADLFVLLADTGMRLGEAVALECRDVNMESELIHVWENKGDRPRSIPMTARVKGLLQPRKLSGEQTGVAKIFSVTSCASVEAMWRRGIKRKMRDDGSPEFPGAVIHAYRHTYASRLVSMGVPLYTVQKLLGHASSKMTERYAHLAPESFQASAKLLDSLVNINSVTNAKEVANDVGSVVGECVSQQHIG